MRMMMFSTPCQTKRLVYFKPQEKLCEDELSSKQKVLYGHLLLFSCPFLHFSRSPLSPNPKDAKQNPTYIFDLH